MPQRPSVVIRSSELRAQRGKSRASWRGEAGDIKADLAKVAEEARRKEAFYRDVTFYKNVTVNGTLTTNETVVHLGGALSVAGSGSFESAVHFYNGVIVEVGNVIIATDLSVDGNISHSSVAKAWCRIVVTAGTPALSGSFNVSSVTDTGTGQATPVWDTDFASTSYAVVATIGSGSNRIAVVGSQAVGSATIVCRDDAGTATDPGQYFVIAFG